jgi:hypothetical protein
MRRLMGLLDMHGLQKSHFERLRHDETPYGEFVGRVTRGVEVDAITLQRLEKCLERRTTHRESWDTTIAAVLDELPST